MKMEKRGLALASVAFAVVLIAGIACAASIDIDNAFIKFSLKQGDYSTKPFTLLGHEETAVNLAVEGLQGLTLNEDSFFISNGETKLVEAQFNASNLQPNVYIGDISIKTKKDTIKLPVILEVESEDVIFDANLDIPPLYTAVAPGQTVLCQIKMFDLTAGAATPAGKGVGPASVEADYRIYRHDGMPIVSSTETIVVNHDTGLTKSFTIPKNAIEGDYFMTVILKYGGSVGISSEVFSVSRSAGVGGFSFGNLSIPWFAGLLGIIALIGLFMYFFSLLVKDRDKFMLALRRYHDVEMDKQRKFLMQQKCMLEKKKCMSPKQIEEQVNAKIYALKTRQRAREGELRRLRKAGNIKAMEAKLAEWKKKGYNTLLIESKLNGLTTSDMKGIMSEWKREGYKLR